MIARCGSARSSLPPPPPASGSCRQPRRLHARQLGVSPCCCHPASDCSPCAPLQSPHWSLAPFGFQRQRTSPRQRASPPAAAAAGARTPSAQQQAAAKAAARVELGKYHVEEIQPAGSPSPTAPLRHRSPRTSPRRGFCAGLYSGAARWVAGWNGSRLAAALLAAVLLGVLLWGGRQLAAQRREELQQWMSYVPAVHPSLAFGAARQAAPTERPQRCQLQLDGSPWERHCQRLRRVCVDQGSLILYEDRYQQMDGRRAGALPELLVDTSKVIGGLQPVDL